MTQARYFSSTATATTLSANITSTATSFSVAALTGYPVSLPFTAIIDKDTANMEVISVTGVSGTTITSCVRGIDGTAAVAHSVGASFDHGVSAQDYNDPQAHMGASANVHGLAAASDVVGTSDTQTLTNKTLTGATLDATSTIDGVSGTTLVGAWTSATPSVSQTNPVTLTASSFMRSRAIGKTVLAQLYASCSTTTSATGNLIWTLPLNPRDTAATYLYGTFVLVKANGALVTGTVHQWTGKTNLVIFYPSGNNVNLGNGDGYIMTAGDTLYAFVEYESA